MRRFLRMWLTRLGVVMVFVLLITSASPAQVQVGDNTKISLDGSLGFGYAGGWGDDTPSTHSTAFNGYGNLRGYYYNPNFLSFEVLPYYNRSQNNAASQAIVNSSGLSSSVNLFSGSYFPGSVFFSKDWTSNGEFGLPGTGSLTQDGSSTGYGVTWSELLPGKPTLTAAFSSRKDSSSILGTTGEFKNSHKDFTLDSTYRWSGWDIRGNYAHRTYSANFPSFLGGETISDIGSDGYGASAQHRIPLSGNFSASWSRTTYDGNGTGIGNSNTNNYMSVAADIAPWRRLSFSSDLRYTDNVVSLFPQAVIPSGGVTPIVYDSMDSKSLISTTFAYLSLPHGFLVIGNLTHREQWYDGAQVSDTQYGGTVSYRYARPLFGMIYVNFGMVDNANQEGNTSLGFTGNAGFNRKFGPWETSADIGYSQNVQTLIAAYTTSGYTYGGNMRRRLNSNTYWHASARAAHSALVQQDGDGNSSQTYSTGLYWRRYGLMAAYSQSSGTSVLTTGGLVPTPLGGLISGNVLVFDGNSTTVSLSCAPTRRLTLTSFYSKVRGNTSSTILPIPSVNNGDRYDVRAEYRLRKLSFIGNYTRTNQVITSFSPTGVAVNTYSMSISRWFNLF
jgi:hypothetical protein